MKKNYVLWIATLSAVLLLAGCGSNPELTPTEYCEQNGGLAQEWICFFEDGSYCEEEAYSNGECQMGEIIFNTVEEEDVEEVEAVEEETVAEATEEAEAVEVTEEVAE